jgi:hypothetical protein
MRSKKDAYLPGLRVHSDVDANGEQSSEVMGLMKKFPTFLSLAESAKKARETCWADTGSPKK